MPTFDETLARLATLPMFEAERPATDAEIRRIESELDVVLPPQYVAFLRRHGYAGWDGSSVLGIRPISRITGKPSRVISDCVTRTKRERADDRLGTASLSSKHVVIATDGGGGNFVLFCEGIPDAGQVHWYALEDSPEPIDKWPTFQDFLEHRITVALES